MPPSRDAARAARAAAALRLRLPRPRRPRGLRCGVRQALRRAARARERASGRRDPARLADPSRRSAPLGGLQEGGPPDADGLAGQGDDGRRAREMGRRRAQAARLGRAGRLRARAEDRRARGQPPLRGRDLRPRRHARRRAPRRGRDREPAHDRRDSALPPWRRSAGSARGSRRGLHAALGLPEAERAARRGGQEADAEPAERRRRVGAAEELAGDARDAALELGLRNRPPGRGRVREPVGAAAVAPGARLSDQPVRRAAGDDRGGRGSAAATGSAGVPSSTTRSTGS